MANDQLKDLFKLFSRGDDPAGTVAVLVNETVKLRDALKQESGRVLTVGDTRAALEVLKDWLSGRLPSVELTADQATLLKAWQKRLLL